jgi:pyridoxal phosphate enzyme (YggS family)
MSEIAEAVAAVRERVSAAARRAGRDPSGVQLVGASKTVPASRLVDALEAGLRVLGENRAQELLAKAPELASRADAPEWHFIGALQRNKVAACAPYVSLWQSVDRPELGEAIAKRAPGARVLVEVNLGEEAQRAGCPPGEVGALVDRLRELGLDVAGLMTIAPQFGDRRAWFATLRALRDTLGLAELSMGMTDDFELAIEEGATIVRVGRAIFGARLV